jgi:bisphosphoglycerate-independent phosphoglycerate mutase (AlkP superfamily)
MSKQYYTNNRDKIIERNQISYKTYYTNNKQIILEKKRQQYKQQQRQHKSYLDLLPEHIINKIYCYKNQLELNEPLNMIKKLRYKHYDKNNIFFGVYSEIKYLFKPFIN